MDSVPSNNGQFSSSGDKSQRAPKLSAFKPLKQQGYEYVGWVPTFRPYEKASKAVESCREEEKKNGAELTQSGKFVIYKSWSNLR